MVRSWVVELWKGYKRSTKPWRRRLVLYACLLGGKLVGRYSFEVLKKLSLDLAQQGQCDEFVRVIHFYDSALPLPKRFSSFVIGGAAHGSINAFRVLSGDYPVFEKIYEKNACEWERCRFFYDHFFKSLGFAEFKVPRLLACSDGHRLLVAHFELLHSGKISRSAFLPLALRVISRLRQQAIVGDQKYQWLIDWRGSVFFSVQLEKTRRFLSLEQLPAFHFESMVSETCSWPVFAGHGDLRSVNAGVGGFVFDWDCFGYYPAEFDVALVLADSLDEICFFDVELECFLFSSYRGLEALSSFEEYSRNVIFLALIFSDRRASKTYLYNNFIDSCSSL